MKWLLGRSQPRLTLGSFPPHLPFNKLTVSAKEQGFRSGVNTGLAVLDARKDLFTARKDLAQSRYLYILNSLFKK